MSGESTRLPPVWMWVEFVVVSRPCSETFFFGHSGFPLSSKANFSKFQFDLDYCQALYHEPLAWEIAKAFPVLSALNKLLYFLLLREALCGFLKVCKVIFIAFKYLIFYFFL